jgi:4'-phosphopantetheinyl transferase EntD
MKEDCKGPTWIRMDGVPGEVMEMRLEHGLCSLVRIALRDGTGEGAPIPELGGHLHPAEAAFASGLPPRRAAAWIAGRVALRLSMRGLGESADSPVLSTPRGAPLMPGGFLGSISHKKIGAELVAAGLARAADGGTLGVDLEIVDVPRESVERAVLTGEERRQVGSLPPEMRWSGTLLRFSIKEAAYKAVDPVAGRFIDYQEVSVFPDEKGGAELRWRPEKPGPKFNVECRHAAWGRYLLATARTAGNGWGKWSRQ